jgi:MFS family permease
MDSIFEEIGPFGRFQKLIIILLGSIFALTSANMYFTVFTTADPKLICNSTTNETDVCKIWSNLTENNNNNNCEFDKTYYDKTIVTEWNLVCDRKYLATLTQTIYMTGSLVSIFCGFLGDLYGRRRTIIGFLIILSIVLLVSEFLQLGFIPIRPFHKYIIYCINLFLGGFIANCIYCNSFVLLMELTTSKYHTISSVLGIYAFIFGELLVLAVAYFIRNWHIYSLHSLCFNTNSFLSSRITKMAIIKEFKSRS